MLQKSNTYKSTQSVALDPGTADAKFGDSVCAQRNNQYVVIGQASQNKIHVYTPQPIDLKPFMVIQSKVVDVGEFGKSVATGQFLKLDKTNKYDDWPNRYEWVVVGAPGTNSQTGMVTFFYKDPKSGSLTSQCLHQPGDLSTNDRFGEKVKMSANGKWCLVTAPGKKKVYVYALNEKGEINTQSLQGDGSTTAFVLNSEFDSAGSVEQVYVRQAGTDLIAERDYSWDHATRTITFTSAPGNNVDLVVRTMDSWRYVDSITGTTDGFGSAVAIDSQGRLIAISSPNESVVGEDSTTRMGAVNLYYRHYQNFTADGTTREFELDSGGAIKHTTPVFVNSTKRNSIENSTVFYTKDDTDPKITFTDKVAKNSTVTIFSNQFRHLQTIAPKFPQAEGNFGSTAIELDENGETLFVGVPEVDGVVDQSGIVEIHRRKDDKTYGRWIHELDPSNYSANETLYINGYKVTTSGTTASSLVTDINNASIPFVDAVENNSKVKLDLRTNNPLYCRFYRNTV